jgi:type VI protein secretion system component VasF
VRVILALAAVIGASAWAGWAVRHRDPIASVLLFVIAALAAAGLVASFLGWPQGD